jgi:hypothetical protein
LLLQLGHCQIADLAKEFEKLSVGNHGRETSGSLRNGINQNRTHMRLANGDVGGLKSHPKDLRETLHILAQQGLISRVRPAHFRSPADNKAEAEKWVTINKVFAGLKGRQLQLEIDKAVEDTLEEWYDGRIHVPQLKNGYLQGKKRSRGESEIQQGRKRARLQNGVHTPQTQVIEESDIETGSLSVSS